MTFLELLGFQLFCPFQILILDINKFLWMVRIGGSTDKGKHIKEWDYYSPSGEFRVDKEGAPTLLNCLMYKMCYYRFGQIYSESGKIFCCCIFDLSRHKVSSDKSCTFWWRFKLENIVELILVKLT